MPRTAIIPEQQISYKFQSKSGSTYSLKVGVKDGVVYCTCPAWRFQTGVAPKDRKCKHIASFERRSFQEEDFRPFDGMVL